MTGLDGNIAIGTEQGLYLYDRRSRKVEHFPGSDELNSKVVSYIVQSNDGDIWCSTSMGIWQYDVSRHRFIGHVNGNGLTQKEYLYGVGMHTDDDRIYFGHNDGLTVFHPSEIKEPRCPRPTRCTDGLHGGPPVCQHTQRDQRCAGHRPCRHPERPLHAELSRPHHHHGLLAVELRQPLQRLVRVQRQRRRVVAPGRGRQRDHAEPPAARHLSHRGTRMPCWATTRPRRPSSSPSVPPGTARRWPISSISAAAGGFWSYGMAVAAVPTSR